MSESSAVPREFLSPQEFAAISGLSLVTVRRYLAAGRVPSVQPGGRRCRVLIPRSALSQFTKAVDVVFATDQAAAKQATSACSVSIAKKLPGPAARWRSEV